MDEVPIAGMRNLGPKMALWLGEIGISDAGQLRRTGPVEAWKQLKVSRGGQISLLGLYAMQAALMGIDWRELPDEFKAALREQALG